MTSSRFYYEPKVTLLARPAFTAPAHLSVNWLGESTDGERLAEFDGTRWTVLYAGPFARRMLPGLQRHIVLEGGGRRFIVEHDCVNQPLTESEVREWLERLRFGSES
jgi:hypothetical protein